MKRVSLIKGLSPVRKFLFLVIIPIRTRTESLRKELWLRHLITDMIDDNKSMNEQKLCFTL